MVFPRWIPRWAMGVLVLCATVMTNCRRDASEGPPAVEPSDGSWFQDGAKAAGITFVHTSGDDWSYLFAEPVTREVS